MKRTLGITTRISGYTGYLLLAISTADLILPEDFLPIHRVWLIIIVVLSIHIYLLLTEGYKRLPFWSNLLLGNFLILTALFSERSHDGFTLLAALFCFILARYVSAQIYLNTRRFALIIPALILSSNIAIGLLAEPAEEISYNNELESVLVQLHPSWESVEGFREDLAKQIDSLSDSKEKEALIDELNHKIALMEEDLKRFESLKEENRQREEEIQSLKDKIGELNLNGKSYETVAQVTTYEEAVRPSSPIVRDFAVKLASAYPGTYYSYGGNNPTPSREGLQQIKAIHRYISSEWAYINDPLFERSDYYSPADRTIALGLAGDCDDYAILMASAIEAIGGKARILYGTCSEGAHAWCEAYIGSADVWRQAQSLMGGSISSLKPGADGAYWLCLDWQIGTYSCGNSPRVLYES